VAAAGLERAMTDPLGLIGQAARAPQGGPERGGPAAGAGGPSFKDVLMKNIDEINKLQQDAAQAVEDLQTGKGSFEGMLIAQNKADMAFKMLQAARNQVLKAYDDIQQMRV
jgi:flagellar hook-basal body complex protein FliE